MQPDCSQCHLGWKQMIGESAPDITLGLSRTWTNGLIIRSLLLILVVLACQRLPRRTALAPFQARPGLAWRQSLRSKHSRFPRLLSAKVWGMGLGKQLSPMDSRPCPRLGNSLLIMAITASRRLLSASRNILRLHHSRLIKNPKVFLPPSV